jgi:hypothetical protein
MRKAATGSGSHGCNSCCTPATNLAVVCRGPTWRARLRSPGTIVGTIVGEIPAYM